MTLEQQGGERLEWPAIDLSVLAGEGDLGEVVGREGEGLPSSRAFPCLLSPFWPLYWLPSAAAPAL